MPRKNIERQKMKLVELIHTVSMSDQIKHWIDIGITATIGGSFIAWIDLIVPEITMLATCISAVLGAAWFIYRWIHALRRDATRNRRKNDVIRLIKDKVKDLEDTNDAA
jgi:hypothetical protein